MVEAMKKIKVISQAEREGGSAGEGAVRVFLKDGRVLVKNMVLLKGTPDYPLTQEELIAKYSVNAKYVLKNDEAKRVKDTILNLENVASIRDMMDTVSLRKKAS